MTINKKNLFLHLSIIVAIGAISAFVFSKSFAGSKDGNWALVGSSGFSAGGAQKASLAIDSDDSLYMAFLDETAKGKLSVMKYDTNAATAKWSLLGKAGFSANPIDYANKSGHYIELKLDSKEVPYVAFIEKNSSAGKSGFVTVMKFNGKSWSPVGKSRFASAGEVSLAMDSKDNLYVEFTDVLKGNNITVMKYDKSLPSKGWTAVGNTGFSARGGATYPSLALDSKNIIYAGYTDVDGKATVMKYDTTTSAPVWLAVGKAGFSVDSVYNNTLMIDSKNTPYFGFQEQNNQNKLSVMKFNGTDWVYVGISGFSPAMPIAPSFGMDQRDVLYAGFASIDDMFKTTVMEFDGSKWTNFGSRGFSDGQVSATSLALNSNNEVYIGYVNSNNGKLSVMKFEGSGNSCESDILDFSIMGKHAEIDQSKREINIRVPYGTKVQSLSPSILISDYASVKPKQNTPVNFTKPQYYVVTAQNKSCKNSYKVTVTVNTWEEVGKTGFTPGDAKNISLALSANGDPYVAFTDPTANSSWNKMSVMSYDDTSDTWDYLGKAGFTAGDATDGSLAINPKTSEPYIAFRDGSQNLKLSVMFYESHKSNWYNVGLPGISSGSAKAIKIAFDSSGNPYVAFAESTTSTKNKISVVKWDGKSWIKVAGGGFDVSSGDVDIHDIDITFDSNNIPYVAFVDSIQDKVSVIKSNGKSWVYVGSAGFTDGTTENVTIAMGPSNSPHVAFKDSKADKKASVMKFNGKSWVYVGSAGFSKTEAYDPFIKFYGSTPFVGFESNWDAGARTTVMKFNGTAWVNVGNTDFSDGQATNLSLVLNKKGIPYVVYQDIYNKYKATVMRHP